MCSKICYPHQAPPLLAPLLKLAPGFDLKAVADHTVGWWLQTEDLPDPSNRVQVVGDKQYLYYTVNNTEAGDRLINRWVKILKQVDQAEHMLPFNRSLAEIICGKMKSF